MDQADKVVLTLSALITMTQALGASQPTCEQHSPHLGQPEQVVEQPDKQAIILRDTDKLQIGWQHRYDLELGSPTGFDSLHNK